eukprot:833525-Pelagomonas_calceolata.AAC.4
MGTSACRSAPSTSLRIDIQSQYASVMDAYCTTGTWTWTAPCSEDIDCCVKMKWVWCPAGAQTWTVVCSQDNNFAK